MKPDESWIGRYWAVPPKPRARLRGAVEQTCIPGVRRIQPVGRTWLLEYTFTPCGRFLVSPGIRKWREIPRATARLFAPRQTRHTDTRRMPGPLHFAYIVFDRPDATVRRMIPADLGFAWFEDPDGRLGAMMVGIARAVHRSGEGEYRRAQDQFQTLLDYLCLAKRTGPGAYRISCEPTSVQISFVDAVDRYLLEHMAEKITLAAVATHLHMAAPTLSHRYRQAAGLPPMTRLRQLRVKRVKELLGEGLPLKMIAMQTGLSDEFNLSRVFKRMTSHRPSQFMKTRR